ncbi:MAG: TonB-dependent receptor [Sulfurimonas sp. RIFOXYD12_FULL_33_39]|uniref:TonB-dependent receptor n=1 Tax=unclassified Sulfurimonas TaxID=2623549 RepID=UPI0008C67B31|nr:MULTISPECIES: TonB-dependent receptor [unclassified Sulfurimonas]OHE10458.1 MAG: TonB-dependent receptor [Sulfurimonas sp. RIFOXYD12_FULL_33_39]OHE14917.1 MAG: TonB-dependent receptor [Sulfurimonas sp. RIFOXYD2_FULL_34_21]
MYRKIIPLSLAVVTVIQANEIELPKINVQSTKITEVSQNAQISADLAQALSSSVPSIDMNRRSGIANDIYIRGQKRDNISVEVDGTKVCGACPNRMDPPVSHILANQIDEVEVIEGPYDVETFGTMSGGLKITTKKPTEDVHGEANFGVGSWGYKKIGATLSGGTDTVRALVSASRESSGQYKDGDGNTIADQIDNYALINPSAAGTKFKSEFHDMDAYTKRSIMSKIYIDVADNQELRLSYTGNRSDDVLYGNSKMDALYDDSNIYSVEYDIKDINDVYKNINLQYYHSDVDHPMATTYRMSSNMASMNNTSHLTTSMDGVKLKNSFDLDSYKLLVGLDASQRNWDGNYYNTTTKIPLAQSKSINDSTTKNAAIFTKLEKTFGSFDVTAGARYDSTDIENGGALASNSYSALNANIVTSYNIDNSSRAFLGFGQASRVPDARELYFYSSNGTLLGTTNLEQTKNREIDLGYETSNDTMKFKVKTFYSILKDYIYLKKDVAVNAFQNIDAKVYGAELSASYYASDDIIVDAGLSYKVGKKDEALAGQTDRDLADMAPLRANVALNYEYANKSVATFEMQASDNWNNIDSDNGEQELGGWAIFNLKAKHAVNKNVDFTLGVNNMFDQTYAMNNSYVDLTLITVGGASDVMLMNEPGRYIYTNLTVKF